MPVRKVGERWLVDIRYKGERYRVRSPGTTKADAQAHEVFLRGELVKHGNLQHLEPVAKPPTLTEFAETWEREYVRPNNGISEQATKHRILQREILPRFGRKRIDEITALDVERLKREMLDRRLSPKTVNMTVAVLRKALVTARDWEMIAKVPPMRMLRAPLPPFRFLEPHEVSRLIASCEPWVRALVVVAVRTGLRWSELVALDWGDVDLERRQVCVARAYILGQMTQTKNGRTRYVPLTRDAHRELEVLPSRVIGRAVFIRGGRRPCYETARMALARACRRACVPVVSWHQLRHTYASHLASAGAPLKAVQELLGHQSLTMTLRYAHLSAGALQDAVRLLDAPQPEKVGTPWAQPTPMGTHAGLTAHSEVAVVAQPTQKSPSWGDSAVVGGSGFEPERS